MPGATGSQRASLATINRQYNNYNINGNHVRHLADQIHGLAPRQGLRKAGVPSG